MGVDCRVVLPGNIRLRDVEVVLGALVGYPVERKELDQSGSWYASVKGITSKSDSDPSYAKVSFDGRYFLYHFEYSEEPGKRLINPSSTAFWCLIGKKLVDFFGGKVDYNDCDNIDWDYEVPEKSNKENSPTNGEEWEDLQRRMLEVKPLHIDDLEAFDKSAYKWAEESYEYSFNSEGFMIRNAK